MYLKHVFSVLALLAAVTCQAQTYMSMDLWVDRVPLQDTTAQVECLQQRVHLYLDPRRIGVVTPTDTVALVVKRALGNGKLYCVDLYGGGNYTYESYVTKNGFIFFLTPDTRRKDKNALYSLIYSTLPCK